MNIRRHWLFKSEPSSYSFSDLMSEESLTAEWDGVRNYQARNFLRDEIAIGDRVLFYHSNTKPPCVVGTALVVRSGYPDYTAWDHESEHPDPKSTPTNPIWYMVDIKGESELDKPVSLAQLKADPRLKQCSIFTRPRLSVHPLKQTEWDIILGLSNSA